jgi:mono/diheme cytochrome c family protein
LALIAAAPATISGVEPLALRLPVAAQDASIASAPLGADVPPLPLFITLCARCHGEDGSGTGPTVLDRPARNFKDGGFSFGNTTEAIVRTLRSGIPGSPMPAFGETVSDEDLHTLAEYVRTLGPPMAEADHEDMRLDVGEQALVVRGILPPIAAGLPLRPRGLLIGLPDGLTFEYRTDDVRLLGVRQGDYVRRTDWTGRGGAALEPLGRLIWTDAGGDPPALLSGPEGEPLSARLRGTTAEGSRVMLRYVLLTSEDDVAYEVTETVHRSTYTSERETRGFVRELEVVDTGRRGPPRVADPTDAGWVLETPPGQSSPRVWGRLGSDGVRQRRLVNVSREGSSGGGATYAVTLVVALEPPGGLSQRAVK